jgi:hypothetical protein
MYLSINEKLNEPFYEDFSKLFLIRDGSISYEGRGSKKKDLI